VAFAQQADEHAVDEVALPDNTGSKMSADAIQQGGTQAAIVGRAGGI
jgi:hypothetical protein